MTLTVRDAVSCPEGVGDDTQNSHDQDRNYWGVAPHCSGQLVLIIIQGKGELHSSRLGDDIIQSKLFVYFRYLVTQL
jgi:hypothetical protein